MKKILFMMVVMVLASKGAFGVNIPLNNGGFEKGWSGLTTAPPGWCRNSTSPYWTTLQSTSYCYSGTASVAFGKTSSATYYIYQNISCAGSKSYTAATKVRDTGYGKVRLCIKVFRGTNLLANYKSNYSTNLSSWQTLTKSFTTPPTADKIRIEVCLCDAPSGYRDTIYVDDVTLDGPDTIVPIALITSPVDNNKVGGMITVSATASDNVGVAKVLFYKNATLVGTDTTFPYTMVYDFNNDSANANYIIKAVAYDYENNTGVASITVNKPNHDYQDVGMNLAENGCFFKLWAPHATTTYLTGDFNNWGTMTHKFTNYNGWWYGFQPGVTAGQRYKFFINGCLWRNDPYTRQLLWNGITETRDSIIVNKNFIWDSFTPLTFNKMVIYEMSVKTFGGYIGVMNKLDYLKNNLGINAIEVMPVHQVPTSGGGWGYNPIGLFAPHSDYGSYQDFKVMVNEAHKKGIAVIVDVVFNHIEGEVLWQYDGWTAHGDLHCDVGGINNSWPNTCKYQGTDGGIYYYNHYAEYNHGADFWHTAWGHNRPNFGRSEVKDYLKKNALFWLCEMNCDGLRFDATVDMRKHRNDLAGWAFIETINDGIIMMQEVNDAVHTAKPNAITIAEDMQDETIITAMSGDNALKFNAQWCEEYKSKMRNEILASDPNMSSIRDMIWKIDHGDAYKLVKYVESHDISNDTTWRLHQKIVGTWNGDATYYSKKKNIIAHAITVLSPGIPMMLQGSECMSKEGFHDGDKMVYNFNEDFALNTYKGIVQAFRDINNMKTTCPAFQSGGNEIKMYEPNDGDNVLVFRRWMNGAANSDKIVIINLSDNNYSNYQIGVPLTGTWNCIYNSDWNGYSSDFGNWGGYNVLTNGNSGWDGEPCSIKINIPKMSVLVYGL